MLKHDFNVQLCVNLNLDCTNIAIDIVLKEFSGTHMTLACSSAYQLTGL